MISIKTISHEQLIVRSNRTDSVSTSPSTIGPTVGSTDREKNRMRVRDSLQDGWVETGTGLRRGRRQRPALQGLRRRRNRQKGKAIHEGNERGGRSRRQKRRDDGGERGAAGSLYPGQAARGRVPRSGGAKPEEAAHRHLDYKKKVI